MRAAGFTEPGGPEVLHTMELPDLQVGPGQVRVRVRAAGVQPFDTAVRRGWVPGYAGEWPWPRVPGNEFAGVVDQVGEGAAWSVGDEVLGFSVLGCYAEYVVVTADRVTAKPAEMPWTVAGGVTAGTQTAHMALRQLGVSPGETVLVHAAAGAVGTAAVQLARLWGATVIGTASEANHAYVGSLGGVPVTYGAGLVERVQALSPGGVHAALDGAGGAALEASLALVKEPGRIVTLVEHDRADSLGAQIVRGQRSAERLAELAGMYARGELQFPVRRTYPLHEAAEAHRELETRHGHGKVVLTV